MRAVISRLKLQEALTLSRQHSVYRHRLVRGRFRYPRLKLAFVLDGEVELKRR